MWYLFDWYVFPNNLKVSAWISLGVGVGVCALLCGWQHWCEQSVLGRSMVARYHSLVHVTLHGVGMRVFLYSISFGVINVWRGVW
jgi:Fuseless